MPQMGLGISSGKSKNRTPSVAFQSDFGSGSHGFTANNATIDGNYTLMEYLLFYSFLYHQRILIQIVA